MRVISGIKRGCVLKTLDGDDTRPTTDRVKESVFNIIQFDIEGRRVLDLFGGSGQLAIEALSRGAASADIAESARSAADIINDNVKKCGFEDRVRLHRGDFSALLKTGTQYDVIFLDPPYKSNLLFRALSEIQKIDILTKGGIIVCESERGTEIPRLSPPYDTRREYLYGKTKITVIRKSAQA